MTQEEIDGRIEVLDREIEEAEGEIEYERGSHREAVNRSEWFDEVHAEALAELEGKLRALRKRRDDLEMAIADVEVEPPPEKIGLFAISRVRSADCGVRNEEKIVRGEPDFNPHSAFRNSNEDGLVGI